MLPVRILPFSDESALGYLVRLAEANSFASIQELLLPTGSHSIFDVACSARAMRRILDLVGAEEDQLSLLPYDHTGHWFSYGVDIALKRHLRLSSRRICPLCLRESPHQRRAWDHAGYVACHLHKVLLSKTCHGCGRAIGWSGIERCLCGTAYRDEAPATLDECLDAHIEIAERAVGRSSMRARIDTDLIVTLQAANAIGRAFCRDIPGHPLSSFEMAKLVELRYADLGMGALLGGPDGLLHHLEQLLRNCRTRYHTFGSHRGLQPLLQLVRELFEIGKGGFIISAITSFTARHGDVLQGMKVEGRPRPDLILHTIDSWSAKARVSVLRAYDFVQIGGKLIDTVGTPLHVSRARSRYAGEVHRAFFSLHQRLTIMEVARGLAIKPVHVVALVRSRLIRMRWNVSHIGPAGWVFSRSQITKFWGNLTDGLPVVTHGSDEWVSLKRALGQYGYRLVELISSILAGELQPVGLQPCKVGFEAILLEKSAITARGGDHGCGLGTALSVQKAAALIGATPRWIPYLLDSQHTGVPTPALISKLQLKHVECFKMHFIIDRELATMSFVSPETLNAHLGRAGIRAETLCRPDGKKISLYRWDEVFRGFCMGSKYDSRIGEA